MEGTISFKDIGALWALLQPSLDQIVIAEESGDASQRLTAQTSSQLYSCVHPPHFYLFIFNFISRLYLLLGTAGWCTRCARRPSATRQAS